MRRWLLTGLLALALPLGAATYDEGMTQLHEGRYAAAENTLTAVLAAQPTPQAFYWRGRARAAQDKWEVAAGDYQAALRLKPDSIPSRLALAEAFEHLGRTREAQAAVRAVLTLEPNNAEARAAAARLGKLNQAGPLPAPAAAPTSVATKAPLTPVAPRRASTPTVAAMPPALPVAGPSAPLGPRVGFTTDGLSADLTTLLETTKLDATGPQLLDYTFGSAPVDWDPVSGVWQVSSRFACDPSWSFFGGYSQGLASVWNKRQFQGDLIFEAYVSFKHGLPWNPSDWGYRPSDLCLTLCGDGANPASGYSFIYAGDNGSRTMIRKGDKILAQTTDAQFLSPSYSDQRPSSEDFHRRWWQLAASRVGKTLTFYIDGQQALQVDDPDPLPGGKVGLWTVHNGMMVARVRIAYQQELRRQEPVVVVREPDPVP